MMNKTKVAVVALLTLNFLTIASMFLSIRNNHPVQTELTVNQRIVLECQKLAAIAQENWSYKSCIDNVKNADHVEAKILKTI